MGRPLHVVPGIALDHRRDGLGRQLPMPKPDHVKSRTRLEQLCLWSELDRDLGVQVKADRVAQCRASVGRPSALTRPVVRHDSRAGPETGHRSVIPELIREREVVKQRRHVEELGIGTQPVALTEDHSPRVRPKAVVGQHRRGRFPAELLGLLRDPRVRDRHLVHVEGERARVPKAEPLANLSGRRPQCHEGRAGDLPDLLSRRHLAAVRLCPSEGPESRRRRGRGSPWHVSCLAHAHSLPECRAGRNDMSALVFCQPRPGLAGQAAKGRRRPA